MEETLLIEKKDEIKSLVQGRKELQAKLDSAGGPNLPVLIGMCGDLADIIDEVEEVTMKREKIEYAAFDTKLKFGRKMRRKAKDLRNFEQEIVRQYDSKNITLEHGRKMAEIVKKAKSNEVSKAKAEAAEFYNLLEMNGKHSELNERLSAISERLASEKSDIGKKLSDLEWLENQPAIDNGKVGRIEERNKLIEELHSIRFGAIRSLQAMPMPGLLSHAKENKLAEIGFPKIDEEGKLLAFLKKSGWESKSPSQLMEISGWSEKKLKHFGIDVHEFRREIFERKPLFLEISALQAAGLPLFGQDGEKTKAYLSIANGQAAQAVGRLSELEKTAIEDRKEWERGEEIKEKKEKVKGTNSKELQEKLRDLESISLLLDGKVELQQAKDDEGKMKSEKGIVNSILDLFKGK